MRSGFTAFYKILNTLTVIPACAGMTKKLIFLGLNADRMKKELDS